MSGEVAWDVVVVGAGAAVPRRRTDCANADCRSCCSMPARNSIPATDYPLTNADWDVRDFPEKPGSTAIITFAPGQKLDGNEPLLASGSRGLGPSVTNGMRWMDKYYHVRGIGGTTLHFTGKSHRLHPDAMKINPLRRGRGLADRLRRTGAVLPAGRRSWSASPARRHKARAGARADFRCRRIRCHMPRRHWARERRRSVSTGRPTAGLRCRCRGTAGRWPATIAAAATRAARAATRAAPMSPSSRQPWPVAAARFGRTVQ